MLTGLFGLFGRSPSLERLNTALRAAGLEPRGLPESLRLALVRLVKGSLDLPQRGEPKGEAAVLLRERLDAAGRLFAYCYLGSRDWGQRHGPAEDLEARLAVAPGAPEGLDARVVSLALLSGYAAEEIAARFEAELPDEQP